MSMDPIMRPGDGPLLRPAAAEVRSAGRGENDLEDSGGQAGYEQHAQQHAQEDETDPNPAPSMSRPNAEPLDPELDAELGRIATTQPSTDRIERLRRLRGQMAYAQRPAEPDAALEPIKELLDDATLPPQAG